MKICTQLITILFCTQLITSCGYFKKSHDEQSNPDPSVLLSDKAQFYCEQSSKNANAAGWVGSECDLLLFNSLRAVVCPGVDITAAEGAPGEYWRDSAHTCSINGNGAAARLSRDMVTGLLIWIWKQGPITGLPILNRFIAYLESHDGYFCDTGNIITNQSYCDPGSGMNATIYEMRFQFGGGDSSKRGGAVTWPLVNNGYQAHIAALHLYLRGVMLGGLSDFDMQYFKNITADQPENVLFAMMKSKFTDGQIADQMLIADTPKFPAGQLPDSNGRCTDYLWQRDEHNGTDWVPCQPLQQWLGTDLIFAKAIANDDLPVNHSSDANPHKLTGGFWPYHKRHR